MKKLIVLTFALMIIGCGNKGNGNSNNSAQPTQPVQAGNNDSSRQLNENDLRQIEALDGRTFGQVVVGLSNLSQARALNTQDLAGFLDQNLNVKCTDICQFRRKNRSPRR